MGESFEEPASGVNYNEWKKYGGYWAADRQTGQFATFVLIEGEEGIRAAEAGMEQMRPLIEQFGVRLESVENLPVLITEAAEMTT